jgi:hypothetical protein
MVYRVRKQLVEEGFEAVLRSKQRATPAVQRIGKPIVRACKILLDMDRTPKGPCSLAYRTP